MSAIWLFSFEVHLRRKKTKTTCLEVLKSSSLKQCVSRLPQWSTGKNSPAKAKGHRFDPWSRKIPHAMKKLGPCATTTEAVCRNYGSPSTLEAVLCNKRSHHNENPEHPEEAHNPHLPQLENACAQQQRHNAAKCK